MGRVSLRRVLSREWLFVLAILVGTCLRLYQLADQVVGDDEWHAIHAARDSGYGAIAVQFGGADVSIPLALYDKAIADTIGLSELELRAPIVFFGLLSLVVFPLLVRRLSDRTTATIFAWLLAISPVHIYFSRYARPYAIAIFCAFVGVVEFYLWWKTGDRRCKRIYGLCAVVGSYFHLSVLPVLLAPLAMAVASRLFVRESAASISTRELRGLVVFVALGLTFLLLPPIAYDLGALTSKAGHGDLSVASFVDALRLLLGTEDPRLLVALLFVAGVGAIGAFRTDPRLALFLCASAAVQLLAIITLRPAAIEYPIVATRYGLFLLPVLLFTVAFGVRTVGSWLGTSLRPATAGLGLLLVVVCVFDGPLGRTYRAPNNFTNHALFQYYPSIDPEINPYAGLSPKRVSSYYFELARRPPGSLRILEAPYCYEWDSNLLPFYQKIHHQNVAVGLVKQSGVSEGEVALGDARFRLRNSVHLLDGAEICRRGIDQVVIHKDLSTELGRPFDRVRRGDIAMLLTHYRRIHGRPLFADDQIAVFDVRMSCRVPRQ